MGMRRHPAAQQPHGSLPCSAHSNGESPGKEGSWEGKEGAGKPQCPSNKHSFPVRRRQPVTKLTASPAAQPPPAGYFQPAQRGAAGLRAAAHREKRRGAEGRRTAAPRSPGTAGTEQNRLPAPRALERTLGTAGSHRPPDPRPGAAPTARGSAERTRAQRSGNDGGNARPPGSTAHRRHRTDTRRGHTGTPHTGTPQRRAGAAGPWEAHPGRGAAGTFARPNRRTGTPQPRNRELSTARSSAGPGGPPAERRTFIALQHVLVGLHELLLLAAVGREQPRHVPGHGGLCAGGLRAAPGAAVCADLRGSASAPRRRPRRPRPRPPASRPRPPRGATPPSDDAQRSAPPSLAPPPPRPTDGGTGSAAPSGGSAGTAPRGGGARPGVPGCPQRTGDAALVPLPPRPGSAPAPIPSGDSRRLGPPQDAAFWPRPRRSHGNQR